MAKKPQICIIHGGNVFESEGVYREYLAGMTVSYDRLLYAPSWKNWLAEQLPGYDVLLPSMPDKYNAKYDDWALFFSKVLPFLRPDAVLIGHSLGGVFLARYFTEHPSTESFAKLILIAAPYDDESDETLGGFKVSDASKLADSFRSIELFYSSDDPVVPFTEMDSYVRDLPNATVHEFSNKQHFNEPAFPELLQLIRET